MLKATWKADLTQDIEAIEALCWKPYGWRLHDKLHDWAYRYGGRKWHDWLVSRKWYRAWGRRRDIYDGSWLTKNAEAVKEAIDADIVERISNGL